MRRVFCRPIPDSGDYTDMSEIMQALYSFCSLYGQGATCSQDFRAVSRQKGVSGRMKRHWTERLSASSFPFCTCQKFFLTLDKFSCLHYLFFQTHRFGPETQFCQCPAPPDIRARHWPDGSIHQTKTLPSASGCSRAPGSVCGIRVRILCADAASVSASEPGTPTRPLRHAASCQKKGSRLLSGSSGNWQAAYPVWISCRMSCPDVVPGLPWGHFPDLSAGQADGRRAGLHCINDRLSDQAGGLIPSRSPAGLGI